MYDYRFSVLRRRCKRCARKLLDCHDNGCIHDRRWGQLQKYAHRNGRQWRQRLRLAWEHGYTDVLPWLREIVGPKRLKHIRLEARSNGRPPEGFDNWEDYDNSRKEKS